MNPVSFHGPLLFVWLNVVAKEAPRWHLKTAIEQLVMSDDVPAQWWLSQLPCVACTCARATEDRVDMGVGERLLRLTLMSASFGWRVPCES